MGKNEFSAEEMLIFLEICMLRTLHSCFNEMGIVIHNDRFIPTVAKNFRWYANNPLFCFG